MKIYTNEKLVRRNARIGQYSSILGLATLAGGMYASFRFPEQIALAWGALILGFTLSQVGIYFGNRWGRRPRPDEWLNSALKGFDDRFAIFHYLGPTAHLFIGPAGLWVFLPRHQIGRIIYDKGRWRQKGGGFIQGYLRLFAQEGLGRPDLDISAEVESVKKYINKKIPDIEFPEIQAALVFTNEKAEIEAEDAPFPALPSSKLKEYIRKVSKTKPLSPEKAQLITDLFVLE
jgi:hypothetical protein